MRRVSLLLLVLLGLAVSLFVKVYSAVRELSAVRTSDPDLDRFIGCLSRNLLIRFRAQASPAHMRACLAIIHNETRGAPAPQIGDRYLGGGPSIGPMQVYRATAKDLGLWTPPAPAAANEPIGGADELEREQYAALAGDEDFGIWLGVAVFAEKLRIANGNLEEAIRRYNGGGAAAESYKTRALAFASDTWGGLA